MAMDKNFVNWVAGYTRRKKSFPAPFCDSPNIPDTATINGGAEVSPAGSYRSSENTPAKLSINLIKFLDTITSEAGYNLYIGIADDLTVCVEYPSQSGGGTSKLVGVNLFAGTIFAVDVFSDEKIIPVVVNKNGTGTQIYVALLAALLYFIHATPSEKTWANEIRVELSHLVSTWKPGAADNAKEEQLAHLAYVSDLFSIGCHDGGCLEAYFRNFTEIKRITPAGIADINTNGLSIDELLSSSTDVSNSHLAERPAFFGFDPLKKKPTEKGAMSPVYRLDVLKEELKLPFHKLTPHEQAMVPQIDEHYCIDENLVNAARMIKADWRYPGLGLAPNYLLEGDSGSGKTMATVFWACVFGIPRTKMTMNPMMDSATLIGAFYPVFNDISDWKISDEDKEAVLAIQKGIEEGKGSADVPKGGELITELRRAFASEEIRDIIHTEYDIPSDAECSFDPVGSWERLGCKGDAPENDEEIIFEANKKFQNVSFRLLSLLTEQAESGGVSYRFIMSELLQAFENGWLLEIQEAASILRPGVLTELNSLMEEHGRIELPNGKHIYRHPDTIVVITTNKGYAGNADVNESLRDRCLFGMKMDLPPVPVMAARAMAQTGFEDAEVTTLAAQVIHDVSLDAQARNIRGSFGMRSLIGWVLDLKRGVDARMSFMNRVLYKMTTRDEDVELLMNTFDASWRPTLTRTH